MQAGLRPVISWVLRITENTGAFMLILTNSITQHPGAIFIPTKLLLTLLHLILHAVRYYFQFINEKNHSFREDTHLRK